MVGAEQSGLRIGSVCKFATAVLAARLTLEGLSGQAVSMAEGLNGADRDAYGFRYGGISSFLFTHCHDFFLL
jgi:hypothetical protein